MNIEEASRLRAQLEAYLCSALRDFEHKTGLSVTSVDLHKLQPMTKRNTEVAAVQVVTEL